MAAGFLAGCSASSFGNWSGSSVGDSGKVAFVVIKVAVSDGNSSYHLTGKLCSSLLEVCMINPWLDTLVLWIHILAAISWVGGYGLCNLYP